MFSLFRQDQRRAAVDESRLAAIQGIALFSEWLEADVQQMALLIPDSTHKVFTWNSPVKIEPEPTAGTRLTFLTYAHQKPWEKSVRTEKVIWDYHPDSGTVSRWDTATGRERPIGNLMAEQLSFTIVALSPSATMEQTLGPGITYPGYAALFLKVPIVAIPLSSAHEDPQLRASKRVETRLVLPLLCRADRANQPHWNYNPSEIVAPPPQ